MDSTLQTSTVSSISEQKYINLRKRLDQLGYRQTLGIESLPLIEKLFNDLVHTTESLKKTKLELSKNVDQLNNSMRNMSLASSSNLTGGAGGGGGELAIPSIQAYKSDNAKLVRENNDLHLEVIKTKEEFEQQIKEIKAKLSRVEHENSDLRFLNTQYLHKMRAVEKESKDKTKKILELQEKNFQAVIQIPNGNKHQFSFRRQRLDIDCMLPGTSSTTSSSSSSSSGCGSLASTASDPYVIDMIKLADDRIAHLQDDLDKFKQCNEILEAKVSNYKSQVENRDREIERLTRCLDGGRSFDAVSLENKLRNNEKLIAHQNLQIEFLQEKNHELERRIHQLIDSKQDDMCEKIKNDDLVRDIKEMNRLARKAEIEKQMVVNQADRELEQAKYELTRSREEINSLDTVVQQLEIEKQSITNEMLSLRNQLDQKQSEINGLHELVERVQDDKAKLAKKISKYLENEKELVQELDAYKSGKRSSSSLTRSNSGKSLTNKLDAHIKNIESERDFYKHEVETLQKLLKSAQLDAHKVSVNVVDCNEMSRQSRKEDKPASRKSTTTVKTITTTSGGGTRCSVCSCHVSKSPTRPNSGGGAKTNQSAVVQNLNNIIAQHVDEIKQLKRERDELKCLLDKFERHMNDIQSNVKLVTNERDKIAQLYDEAKEELRAARCELVKSSSKTSNASLAAQAIMKRIENERDSAIFDLKNTANERDSYRERLRMTTEAAIKDKSCLEQQIDDLESRQRNLEYDKKELCKQIDMCQQQIEQLEHSLRSQNEQLAMTMQDLQDQKDTSNQIRMLAEESERALDEQRRQLAQKNDELHQMEQAKFRVEQKFSELQELCRGQKDELAQLRFTAQSLDKDKDKLLLSIDEKTVENVTFKQELASKHRRIDELNSQLAQLEAALDHSNDELKCKLKEITQLRIQCDRLNEENSELGRHYESACRENKRLQEDFMTMTRENQVLHCELEKANNDKERLRDQLQDYINEVQKFEELLKQKEHDRSNLLDQYKDVSNELGQMKMNLNAVENEVSNLRMETQMKGGEIKRLRERLDAAERDFQHQLAACQEYEVKLSSANRNIQRLEEMCKMSQTESKEMGQEVMHMRELNANLEQSRDELSRKLSNKEVEVEELQNAIGDKRVEIDLLKSQLNTERTKVNQLEDMMAHNHEKDLHMQLSTQERDSEIKLLKERIVISEQKLQSQNKEINVLRTKLVEYENEAERLKRQLTNERFERERANQELRKLTECGDMITSKYGGRCMSPPISRTVIFSGGGSSSGVGATSTVMTTTTSCHGSSNMSSNGGGSSSCAPPVILPTAASSSSSSTTSSSCQYHHNQLCPHSSSSLSTHGGGMGGNSSSSSAAAAAVAAAAAAVANVTSSSSYHKSNSPIRSKSPCKDMVSAASFAHKSSSFSASSNLRY